jgi:hypothetical protein
MTGPVDYLVINGRIFKITSSRPKSGAKKRKPSGKKKAKRPSRHTRHYTRIIARIKKAGDDEAARRARMSVDRISRDDGLNPGEERAIIDAYQAKLESLAAERAEDRAKEKERLNEAARKRHAEEWWKR